MNLIRGKANNKIITEQLFQFKSMQIPLTKKHLKIFKGQLFGFKHISIMVQQYLRPEGPQFYNVALALKRDLAETERTDSKISGNFSLNHKNFDFRQT